MSGPECRDPSGALVVAKTTVRLLPSIRLGELHSVGAQLRPVDYAGLHITTTPDLQPHHGPVDESPNSGRLADLTSAIGQRHVGRRLLHSDRDDSNCVRHQSRRLGGNHLHLRPEKCDHRRVNRRWILHQSAPAANRSNNSTLSVFRFLPDAAVIFASGRSGPAVMQSVDTGASGDVSIRRFAIRRANPRRADVPTPMPPRQLLRHPHRAPRSPQLFVFLESQTFVAGSALGVASEIVDRSACRVGRTSSPLLTESPRD